MRLTPKLISAGLFVIAIILFTLVFTHETKVVAQPPATEDVSERVVTSYIEKVELQNEREREERKEAYLHDKLAKAKKESVECKFWQQQLATKVTPKNKGKVTQFCELTDESSSTSSPLDGQSSQPAQKP